MAVRTIDGAALDDWWYAIKSCFNGLDKEQQEFVVREGYLPFGYKPKGTCKRRPEVGIETRDDCFPGPRFYCRKCAIEYLTNEPKPIGRLP